MKFILVVFVSVFSFQAVCAGTFELKGKVRSFSPTQIQINDGFNVYTIEKNKLTPTQKAKLKNLKFGAKVSMHLPFTSVSKVKKLASKSKK